MKVSLTTTDGRHTLRIERRFAHPTGKVWEAMIRPEHLSAWYPMKTDHIDPSIGATIDFVDQEGNHYTGEITEIEPGRVLAWHEDGADELRWELTDEGDGTLLVFTHTFAQGPPPAQHATGWHVCLDILDSLLEGRPLPPHAHDEGLERHYGDLL